MEHEADRSLGMSDNTLCTTISDCRRIPADLKQTVYCTALKHGGLEEWNFAYKQYTIANVAVEKHKLLRSLSCSSKPWVLNR